MIRVAICDDDAGELASNALRTRRYFTDRGIAEWQCQTFSAPFLLLEDIEKNGDYDILLLDIYLPGLLGTDIAKEIRQRKAKTEIIFLTESTEFAVEAFSLGAAHYLTKPFTQEQLGEALDRVRTKILRARKKNVYLKLEGGAVQVINLDDICYVESCAHVQHIYMNDGQVYKMRQTMAGLIELFDNLASGQFINPYKGYIVNQKEIRAIHTEYIMMYNGQHIPINKRGFRKIQESYFNFTFKNQA